MRRVLAVIPAPTFGGSANQMLQLHEPLRAQGWDVLVTVPTEPGNAGQRLRGGGLQVIGLPTHRTRAVLDPRAHVARLAHMHADIAALRQIVREQRVSVVMNHGDLNPDAGIAGHLEGAAVSWQLLDTRTPPMLRRVTMPLVTRLADSIVTVGVELANIHPGVTELGERWITIYPPVVRSHFEAARERCIAARAELGVPANAFCVGAIGNRNPQKGHEWLVRAAGRARAELPQLAILIMGASSPGHESYEREYRREAAALGFTEGGFTVVDPGARVPELIGALDVLCVPSVPNSEGIPTVIMEAMAAGIPVVATDVGALSEVVVDGESGLIVPPLDSEALGQAIVRLGREPDLRDRLVASAHARLAAEYGVEKLVDRYALAFERAIAHRRTRRRRRAVSAFA